MAWHQNQSNQSAFRRCLLAIIAAVVLAIALLPLHAGDAKPYEAIDQHALKATPDDESSVASLAAYLTVPCKTDKEKARAIFRWIADRVRYDADAFFAGKPSDTVPEAVLKSRKAVCTGYANLFASLSAAMALKAAQVPGYAKGSGYVPGQKFTQANHAWMAVHFDDKWWLIDPTWGAGSLNGKDFVKRFSEFYFRADPEKLIFTHFPKDAKWQLLDPPITMAQFEREPKVDFGLWQLGLTVAAVRAEMAKPGFNGLVKVYDGTYVPKTKLVAMPISKSLKAGEKYAFEFKSDDYAEIVVLMASKQYAFKKSGDDFQLTLQVQKGNVFIGGRPKTAKQFTAMFEYVVE
jgi:hypothetical protein